MITRNKGAINIKSIFFLQREFTVYTPDVHYKRIVLNTISAGFLKKNLLMIFSAARQHVVEVIEGTRHTLNLKELYANNTFSHISHLTKDFGTTFRSANFNCCFIKNPHYHLSLLRCWRNHCAPATKTLNVFSDVADCCIEKPPVMSYLHTRLPRVHYLRLNGPVCLGLESSLEDKSLCWANKIPQRPSAPSSIDRSGAAGLPPLASQVICVISTA